MEPELESAIAELQTFADDYLALEQLAGCEPFRNFPPEVRLPKRVNVQAFAEDVAIRERSRLHLGDQPLDELRAVVEQTGAHVLAHQFYVSAQAAAVRLEDLGLLPRDIWEALTERGFKPGAARQLLGLPTRPTSEDPFPERYRYLAVQAYLREAISEGQLARFLRTDRVTAREIVDATLTSRDLDAEGREQSVQMPKQLSLFDLAS